MVGANCLKDFAALLVEVFFFCWIAEFEGELAFFVFGDFDGWVDFEGDGLEFFVVFLLLPSPIEPVEFFEVEYCSGFVDIVEGEDFFELLEGEDFAGFAGSRIPAEEDDEVDDGFFEVAFFDVFFDGDIALAFGEFGAVFV